MKQTIIGARRRHRSSPAPALAANETIAVFTKNQTNPYFQAVRVGADAAAKALGAKAIQYIPTKPDSIPEQLSPGRGRDREEAGRDRVHPGRLQGAGAGGREDQRGRASRSSTSPTASPAASSSPIVGADDYNIGLATARYPAQAMGGKGNVVILEGVKGSLTNTDRVRGFNDALKENPNVKLLASQPANYQRLNALQVMENLMQSHPQIDGVLAANDPMAVGAIEALEGANRKALVVGINGSKEAVELIKAGKLLAIGRLQRLHPGLPRHRDRDPQPAQGADPEGDHPQAGGDREEQHGRLRGAGRAAQLPEARRRGDELTLSRAGPRGRPEPPHVRLSGRYGVCRARRAAGRARDPRRRGRRGAWRERELPRGASARHRCLPAIDRGGRGDRAGLRRARRADRAVGGRHLARRQRVGGARRRVHRFRADEPGARAQCRGPRLPGAARHHPQAAQCRAARHRPVLSDRSRRRRLDRRHDVDARLRHHGGALRHHARQRDGARGRAGRRPRDPHQPAREEIRRRLRPHPAVRRRRGHARRHHRDHAAAASGAGGDLGGGLPVRIVRRRGRRPRSR